MSKKIVVNYQNKWKEVVVDIDKLVLDPGNIRLEADHKFEEDIITDLFANEDAMDILSSIYENGFFPDESPVVIKEKGSYLVIEGNRRVASLKVMINPQLAPQKFVSKIEKMVRGASLIKKIGVRVASGREEVMQYLAAKHTKNTRKQWSALRRAYFYYAQKERGESVQNLIKKYKGVDIPSYIKMYEMHRIAKSIDDVPEEIRSKVSSKNFNISTLERLYEDKYVQNRLGIMFDSTTGEVKVPKSKEFNQVYGRIITDILDKKITSRVEIKDASDRKKYLDKILPEKIPTDGGRLSASKFKPKELKQLVPKILVPNDIVCTLQSPGIERVLRELQSIDYRKFPNATHDLLRSFLEAVLKKYLQRIGETPAPKRAGGYIYLDEVLEATHAKFKKESSHELRQVVEVIRRDKEFLDSINHNPSIFSTDKRVKEQWDQMEELIRYIFQEMK